MKQIKMFKTLDCANSWLSTVDRENIYNIKVKPVYSEKGLIYIIVYDQIKPIKLDAEIDFLKMPRLKDCSMVV